jgi:hypothetical protein
MSLWAISPVVLFFSPSVFGLIDPAVGFEGYLHDVGIAWLYLGIGGMLFRVIHLFFIKDVMTGLVWGFKIMTDPFHDFMIYRKAPLALLRGELIDPMLHVREHEEEFTAEDGDEAKTLP